MKIAVDRTRGSEGELVFTVKVSEMHNAPFGVVERELLKKIDVLKESLQDQKSSSMVNDVVSLLHRAKERAFDKVLDNLKFAIVNEFEPKFKHICQEIYNCVYESQDVDLKSWMADFGGERVTYYFDNDYQAKNVRSAFDPNFVADDKFDDSDLDDDEYED